MFRMLTIAFLILLTTDQKNVAATTGVPNCRTFLQGDFYIVGLFQNASTANLPWVHSIIHSVQAHNVGKANTLKVGYIVKNISKGDNSSIKSVLSHHINITVEHVLAFVTDLPSDVNIVQEIISSSVLSFFYNAEKTDYNLRNSTLVPIRSSIYYEAALQCEVIRHFSWRNIGIINIGHKYKSFVELYVLKLLQKENICLHYASLFPYENSTSTQTFLRGVGKDSSVKTVLVWGAENDTLKFFQMAESYNTTEKTWIGNLDWTQSKLISSMTSFRRLFRFQVPPNKDLQNSTCKQINHTSTHLNDIWVAENTINRILNNIDHVVISTNQTAQISSLRDDIIKTFRNPLHNINITIVSQNGDVLAIRNSSNQTWHTDSPWVSDGNFSNHVNKSCTADHQCSLGYKRKVKKSDSSTYWERSVFTPACWNCRNEFSCIADKESLPFTTERAYVVYTLMAVGAVVSITVVITFYAHRNTPYVKASQQMMSLIQLFAHLLLFIAPIMFVSKPTMVLCIARPIAIGILFTFVMAMTLNKTQKLVFIFQSRIKVSKRHVQMSKTIEVLLIVVMLFVQCCIALFSFLAKRSRVVETYDSVVAKRVLTCSTEEVFIIQLLFGFLLVLMCMIQAFKARNLPENFNESKLIFLTMLLCMIAVAVAIPLRFLYKKEETKLFIDIILLLVMNIVLLVIMYGHKCWIILFRPEQNTTSAFKENVQAHVLKGVLQNRFVTDNRHSGSSSQLELDLRNTIRVNIHEINKQ